MPWLLATYSVLLYKSFSFRTLETLLSSRVWSWNPNLLSLKPFWYLIILASYLGVVLSSSIVFWNFIVVCVSVGLFLFIFLGPFKLETNFLQFFRNFLESLWFSFSFPHPIWIFCNSHLLILIFSFLNIVPLIHGYMKLVFLSLDLILLFLLFSLFFLPTACFCNAFFTLLVVASIFLLDSLLGPWWSSVCLPYVWDSKEQTGSPGLTGPEGVRG